jgi:hypothetical protein
VNRYVNKVGGDRRAATPLGDNQKSKTLAICHCLLHNPPAGGKLIQEFNPVPHLVVSTRGELSEISP